MKVKEMMNIIDTPKGMLYTTVGATLVALFSGLRYYSLSGGQRITSVYAKQLLKTNVIRTVIDVRTQAEYAMSHYPYALNIPVQSINEQRMKGIMKHLPILIYCNTGQRARIAAEKMKKLGFEKVYYIADSHNTLV